MPDHILKRKKVLPMKPIKTIDIWGDSILKGIVYSDDEKKYRPAKLSAVKILEEEFTDITFKNYSRFGNTINRGEEQIKRHIISGKAADMTIIEFGGNDCDFKWKDVSAAYLSEHIPNTTRNEYKESIVKVINLLRESGSIPVIMNLPPISADKYFDWFCRDEETDPENVLRWLREKQIIYRTQELYSHTADITAKELDTVLMDVRTSFLEIRNYSDYLCTDGIHLNEKGQKVLGEIMIEQLKKIIQG